MSQPLFGSFQCEKQYFTKFEVISGKKREDKTVYTQKCSSNDCYSCIVVISLQKQSMTQPSPLLLHGSLLFAIKYSEVTLLNTRAWTVICVFQQLFNFSGTDYSHTMLIIDHSQSALHLLALPSPRHHNSPPLPNPFSLLVLGCLLRCKNIGATFLLSRILSGFGGRGLMPFVPRTSAGWQAVTSRQRCPQVTSPPDPLAQTPHARRASHHPSWLKDLSHSFYFATAGKVRLAVTWKGASGREGSKAKCGGVQEKGGKERGN